MAAPPRTDPGLWIVLVVALLILVPGLVMLGFMVGFGGPWMMGGTWGTMSWGGWLSVGVVFAVLGIVVALLLRAVRAVPPPTPFPPPYAPPPAPGPSEALRVLDLRYAKGEISREEYARMRSDLEGRAR